MRIQHNIPAMNSLTNYTRNNNALAGNLEKLSSGYRINSAADDAAGLAISEKMRSQIKGLEKAYDNANDGISLVQTAEGALTEVNSMLTRLKELATQSANGTYQDKVDREAIQDETNALLEEIDRISDATNFNGIDLLNGNLSGGGGSSVSSSTNTTVLKAKSTTTDVITSGTAVANATSVTLTLASGATVAAGDKLTLSLVMSDGTKKDLNFEVGAETTASNNYKVMYDGEYLGVTIATDSFAVKDIGKIAVAILNNKDKTFSDKYTASGGSDAGFTITSKEKAFDDPNIESATIIKNGTPNSSAAGVAGSGKGDFKILNTSKMTVFSAGANATEEDLDKAVVAEIQGQKFAFAKDEESARALKSANITGVIVNGTTVTASTHDAMLLNAINMALGTNMTAAKNIAGGKISLYSTGEAAGGSSGAGNGGLRLQIGDTNQSFQQVTVSIDDMGTEALGLRNGDVKGKSTLDLSSQDSAGRAIDVIKKAVDTVSAQRGRLGALQNRLDHTLNNLDATTENITSSESQIRDVNMAKEMTAYTKNNILAQAAQSMLAQANSMPQGVLQLLQ